MTNQGREPDPRKPLDMRDALELIRDPEFCKSNKFAEQQHRAERRGAHPDIIEFDRVMVRNCREFGIPVFSHCIVRSLEQQRREYEQGDSKVLFGAHNVGMATDIIHGTRGWNLDRDSWKLIGHLGQDIIRAKGLCLVSLAWGGNWNFYDPAHWEVAGWRDFQKGYPWQPTKHWEKGCSHLLAANSV